MQDVTELILPIGTPPDSIYQDYIPYLKLMIEYDSEEWRAEMAKAQEEEAKSQSRSTSQPGVVRRSSRVKVKRLPPHFQEYCLPYALAQKARNAMK